MKVQQGQTAQVRVRASRPGGSVPREGYAVAEFWRPGRDPEHDPADRLSPDRTVECLWDEAQRSWTALADTGGWEPGRWTVRGSAALSTPHGPAKGWAWGTLEVTP